MQNMAFILFLLGTGSTGSRRTKTTSTKNTHGEKKKKKRKGELSPQIILNNQCSIVHKKNTYYRGTWYFMWFLNARTIFISKFLTWLLLMLLRHVFWASVEIGIYVSKMAFEKTNTIIKDALRWCWELQAITQSWIGHWATLLMSHLSSIEILRKSSLLGQSHAVLNPTRWKREEKGAVQVAHNSIATNLPHTVQSQLVS